MLKAHLYQWKVSILLSENEHTLVDSHTWSHKVFKFINLTLHLWQFKLHLWVLLNKMASPQNCSYCKSTLDMLILHLWQITVKFNITPLTVIKFLPSSILNIWQSLSSGLHIEAKTGDAKFNITPLAFSSLLSSTIHLTMTFPRTSVSRSRWPKFKIMPLILPPLLSLTIHLWQWYLQFFSNETKILWS